MKRVLFSYRFSWLCKPRAASPEARGKKQEEWRVRTEKAGLEKKRLADKAKLEEEQKIEALMATIPVCQEGANCKIMWETACIPRELSPIPPRFCSTLTA